MNYPCSYILNQKICLIISENKRFTIWKSRAYEDREKTKRFKVFFMTLESIIDYDFKATTSLKTRVGDDEHIWAAL